MTQNNAWYVIAKLCNFYQRDYLTQISSMDDCLTSRVDRLTPIYDRLRIFLIDVIIKLCNQKILQKIVFRLFPLLIN